MAKAQSAQPLGTKKKAPDTGANPVQAAFEMIVGFVPWVVYWILVGNVPFRVAILLAFVLSMAVSGLSLLRRRSPKVLEIGSIIVFLLLLVVAFLTSDVFLERWIQPLSNAGLLAISLGSLLMGKPFTLQYAREQVSPEVAEMSGFLFVNKIITWVWVVTFAIMTGSAIIPPALQGSAALTDGSAALSIVCYWIIPCGVLGLAAVFSYWFPDWFTRSLDETAPGRSPSSLAVAHTSTLSSALERGRLGAIQLSAQPQRALIDAPVQITLEGVPSGATVVISATTIDITGRQWQSSGRFRATVGGIVDLTSQAPIAGTYNQADPMGFVWSMRPTDGEAPDLFIPSLDPMLIPLTAEVEGVGSLGTMLVRESSSPEVRRIDIRQDGVIGTLFLPEGASPSPGVVLFSGSEGGIDSQASTAALLASHGYAALVVGYFGVEGLAEQLVEIPLERLAEGIRWLRAHPQVDQGRVAGLAISKGAEGLLTTAAAVPDLGLEALILISPSSVVWQAVGDQGTVPGKSSWTYRGEPVPFVPMHAEALMPEILKNAILAKRYRQLRRPPLMHLRVAYSLSNKDAVEQATIAAERVDAPILCLTGAADEVWPSSAMAAAILRRRAATDRGQNDHHEEYPEAGHLIRMPYLPTTASWTAGIAFGGTPSGLAAAQADAGPRILAFLRTHLL